MERVCVPSSFCMGRPSGWSVADSGATHITISHPNGPDATIGFIAMNRVVESAGATWPQSNERVVRSLWALFNGGNARLENVTLHDNGTVRSVGEVGTGLQYHLLIPVEGATAVGIVVRTPSAAWRLHADAIFEGFRLD